MGFFRNQQHKFWIFHFCVFLPPPAENSPIRIIRTNWNNKNGIILIIPIILICEWRSVSDYGISCKVNAPNSPKPCSMLL